MEEFRESVGAAGVEWDGNGLVGLDVLQQRVQDQGRRAIDDKIVTFQVYDTLITSERFGRGGPSHRFLRCF